MSRILIPDLDESTIASLGDRVELARQCLLAIGHQHIQTVANRTLVMNDGDRDFCCMVEKSGANLQAADMIAACEYTRQSGMTGVPMVFTLGNASAYAKKNAQDLSVRLFDRTSAIAAAAKANAGDESDKELEDLSAYGDAMSEMLEAMEVLERDKRENKLKNIYWKKFKYQRNPDGSVRPPDHTNVGPYEWQVKLHAAGRLYMRRAVIAANRVGKSECGAAETAMHAIGRYPSWWKGRVFRHAPTLVIGADTNENLRNIVQPKMLGEDNKSGYLPPDNIVKITYRQAGIDNVVDTITVRHSSGGLTTILCKSYEQGRKKWQGTAWDFIWLDEEPPMDIYSEAITRLATTDGSLLLTFTPLNGATEVVKKFVDDADAAAEDGDEEYVAPFVINATWNDAPHLTKKVRKQLLAAYPEHEADARTRGIPLAGSGRVISTSDEQIEYSLNHPQIADHWPRLCAIDFGMNHPFAAVWGAHDRDTDTIYIYDAFKVSGETATSHAAAIRERGDWIRVAWPHDGLHREKSNGEQLKSHYIKHGVNMLPISARFDDDKAGTQSVEQGYEMVNERLRTGRLRVAAHLADWFREKRMLHRDKNQKIVDKDDDLMSATRYLLMMMRWACTLADVEVQDHVHDEQPAPFNPFDW